MQPTISDLHVNALLTNLSLMYAQEAKNFVADSVFPTIPVTKKSDRYTRFSRADFNRNLMRVRAPGAESAGGGWTVDTTPTYDCAVWGLHKDIDDQIRGNADAVFNLDVEATRFLTNQALISKEIAWATAFFGSSIWTGADWLGVANGSGTGSGGGAGTNQVIKWSDYINSTPIQDVRNLKRNVQLANGGFRPNKMVIGRQTFDTLMDHPDFIYRLNAGQTPGGPALVNATRLAEIFELDEVKVMDAIQNTGVEAPGVDSGGTFNANEVNGFIGSTSSVLLVYTPDAPGLNTPGCGYNFAWTGYLGANAIGGRLGSFYIPQIKSERVEIELAYVFKQVAAEMGGFIGTLV